MSNETLVDALCALLAVMLLWAAVVDIRTFTISNGINLAIALLAPVFWWATGTDLWPDAAIRVGVAVGVFLLFALAFQVGAMGGGTSSSPLRSLCDLRPATQCCWSC